MLRLWTWIFQYRRFYFIRWLGLCFWCMRPMGSSVMQGLNWHNRWQIVWKCSESHGQWRICCRTMRNGQIGRTRMRLRRWLFMGQLVCRRWWPGLILRRPCMRRSPFWSHGVYIQCFIFWIMRRYGRWCSPWVMWAISFCFPWAWWQSNIKPILNKIGQ